MKNREKEEKWAERCRLYLLSQIRKGVFDEIIFVINSPVIFGGRPAINGEFPHMGAIGWRSKDSSKKWVFKCGGALISENFVLTAAHCSKLSLRRVSDIVNRQPEIVRLGVNDITSDEFEVNGQITDVKIKHIIVHPKYASPKKYYDIALIELEQEVKFIGNLQPACLWINNDFSELGNTASVTGWGYTENGHQSEVLRTATIPVIDTKQCEPLLVQHRNRNWNGLTNHQICAGNLTGGVDTCQV
nr:serine protease snake-like [Danaus plexippus plexippus]